MIVEVVFSRQEGGAAGVIVGLDHFKVLSFFPAIRAILRKIIESDRSFSSNPDSHFHRKRTAVFMRGGQRGGVAAAHAGVVSGV